MRATRLLSRVLLTLLSPGRGVALQGPAGDLGMSNIEQLERTVRDINRLEATLENALPANLRAVANASQNWSPLDEEQERQEAEVNAAVAAATEQERRATEQLAAARAQAAAVGARRQVRRFVNAGMLSRAPPPPPSPNAQTTQQLALEAQEVCPPPPHSSPPFERTAHTLATPNTPSQALTPSSRRVARRFTQQRWRCAWRRSRALRPHPCRSRSRSNSRSRSRSRSRSLKQARAAPSLARSGLTRCCRPLPSLRHSPVPPFARLPRPPFAEVAARLHEAMNLGEALTFETRRGAEQLEQTVRDINRLEAMPATPVRLQLPAATADAMTASAAASPPALRDAAPLPSLRREEGSPAQPQPPPEPWSLPPAGEGGEAARAAMRARLDAAPRVEHVCPACLASALLACWPAGRAAPGRVAWLTPAPLTAPVPTSAHWACAGPAARAAEPAGPSSCAA